MVQLALALLLLAWALPAPQTRAQEEAPLRVGVSQRPPLAIHYEESWDGVAVQLWLRIARDLEIDYEWVELEAGEEVAAVRDGEVDVVISAVATADAEEEVDFSHSYFASSPGYVESIDRQVVDILRSILTPGFWRTAALVVLVLLVVGTLTWLFERRQNPEDFGGGWRRGLWSGFWFAAVTMTAVGYGDKTPKTIAGRLVALFWMLLALAIAATLTARIISIVALGGESSFRFPEELRGRPVGAVDDSLSADFLEEQAIDFTAYASTEEGLRAVGAGEVRIFVHEVAALRYYGSTLLAEAPNVTQVSAGVQRYAFALPPDSQVHEGINRAILHYVETDEWPELLARFQASDGP